jgi:hypothetical protein
MAAGYALEVRIVVLPAAAGVHSGHLAETRSLEQLEVEAEAVNIDWEAACGSMHLAGMDCGRMGAADAEHYRDLDWGVLVDSSCLPDVGWSW